MAESFNPANDLKKHKLRVTPARLSVLTMLGHAKIPLAADQIRSALAEKHVIADRVTVFRILNTFTKNGLVRPIELHEGKVRYEYAGNDDHHHFICEACGEIQDVYDCSLSHVEKQLVKTRNVVVHRHALEFFGLCASCKP